jgi:RHS repeat-associated protein
MNYTYTPEDRVQTMAVSSGPTQTYAYYPDGSLNTIQWSVVGGNFKYTYTPTGQYQEITFPNGQKRIYAYDDQGRLTQLSNTLGASTLAGFSYGYDHDWASGSDTMLGQRTSMTATVPVQGLTAAESRYSYDPLYQLVKVQYPAGSVFSGETHEWTYDALGNRVSSKVNGTGPTYTYLKNGTNPLNAQRLSSDGVNAYSYDPNGSQLTRTGAGGNFGFGHDTDNRLTSITGTETATYGYDYQGRRISKTEAGVTITYLYDGLNPIAETVSGSPKYVLNGPSIDEPLAVSASGTITYLNVDGLGSIIATNNAAGTVSHSLSFDAWGLPRNETGTRAHGFTYTGRDVGVAGQHFYRARFMQPGVGRFTSEDPLRFDAGLNFYAYVRRNPVSFTDALGLTERPGFWESLIPVWGSGKTALHDFECGHWGWGLLNTGIAISDVFLVKTLVTTIGKVGVNSLWKSGAHNWDATRSWLTRRGWRETKGNHMHHAFLERNRGIGSNVPDGIKNQPWNLVELSPEMHMAMDGNSSVIKLNPATRLWYGTPDWAKGVAVSGGGRALYPFHPQDHACECD